MKNTNGSIYYLIGVLFGLLTIIQAVFKVGNDYTIIFSITMVGVFMVLFLVKGISWNLYDIIP